MVAILFRLQCVKWIFFSVRWSDLEEDEDAMLARALEESLRTPQPGHPPPEQPQPSTSTMPPAAPSVPAASIKAQWQGLFQQHGRTTMGPPPPVKVPPGKPAARRGRPPAASVPPPAPNVPHIITTRDVPEDQLPDPDQIEEIPGLDRHASRLWIYPTNYPVRSYQLHIVYRCLFENTLVVLPTGLGKTFIAAVVMYNYYRWYPRGKIVFMAPTKPLVAQQIEACYNIVGIPQADTAEMTGKQRVINTLRLRQNGRHFPDDIFNCIFLNENVRISIQFSLKFVPKGSVDNKPALVQVMAWHRTSDKPLPRPMMAQLVHWCISVALAGDVLIQAVFQCEDHFSMHRCISYHFAIWQASRQHCCRVACQISEQLEKSKPESCGFRTSWDLAVRCLTA